MQGFHMALQDYSAAVEVLARHDDAAGRCAARRSATALDRRRRARLLAVLLHAPLEPATDERTGGRARELRGVTVADLVAERAADGGAERGARDRVLILGLFGHRDFFVPAFLDGRGSRGRSRRGLDGPRLRRGPRGECGLNGARLRYGLRDGLRCGP